MSRKPSKRPSPHVVDLSDTVRVPVPGLENRPNCARYLVTPLGRVYRDDGRLLAPRSDLKVRLNGNSRARTVPHIVTLAFGHPLLLTRWTADDGDLRSYRAWVHPFGPKDSLTGQVRCTVNDVVLVPHAELIRFGRYGRWPTTRLPILKPPPR